MVSLSTSILTLAFAFSFVRALKRLMSFLVANPTLVSGRLEPGYFLFHKEVDTVTTKGFRVPFELL